MPYLLPAQSHDCECMAACDRRANWRSIIDRPFAQKSSHATCDYASENEISQPARLARTSVKHVSEFSKYPPQPRTSRNLTALSRAVPKADEAS